MWMEEPIRDPEVMARARVLFEHPELLHHPCRGGLRWLMKETVPKVSEATLARVLRQTEEIEPMRKRTPTWHAIASWLQEDLELGESLRRRELLVQEARIYLVAGGSKGVGYHALISALDLRLQPFQKQTGDDGRGPREVLSLQDLRGMTTLWLHVREALTDANALPWVHLRVILWSWCHPSRETSHPLSTEHLTAIRGFAQRVLSDLKPLAEGRAWIASALAQMAERVDLRLGLQYDEEFDLLYPRFGESHRPGLEEDLDAVAKKWKTREPNRAARTLADFHTGAEVVGRLDNPSIAARFTTYLAAEVTAPESWFEAFLAVGLPPALLRPMLTALVQARRPGWQSWLRHSLQEERLQWIGLAEVLTLESPPEEILEEALAIAPDRIFVIAGLCGTSEVPLSTLKRLLTHSDWEVAATAAVGEWSSTPSGRARAEVDKEWRSAIRRAASVALEQQPNCSLRYWIPTILSSTPDLVQQD